MKKLMLSMTLLATSAWAGTNQECVRADDGDDWRILLDDTNGIGNFFDNDHDTALVLTQTLSLQSLPPQTQNTYEGLDGEIAIKVIHNKTMRTATLLDAAGTDEESSYDLDCYDVDSDDEG